MGLTIKILMVLLGISVLSVNFLCMSKRTIMPSFGVAWTLYSFLLIVLGAFLKMDQLELYVSRTAFFGMVFGVTVLTIGGYIISLQISELFNRNMEMIMQVSLLNEENMTLKKRVKELCDRLPETVENRQAREDL